MSATFSRTLRSLRAETSRVTVILLGLVLLVLAVWIVWLAVGQVALYEVTASARLEVRDAVHPVAAARGGRVVRVDAEVGRSVEAGAVLFELDAEAERLAVGESSARLADLEARIAALEAQIDAETQALIAERDARDSAVKEARAWSARAQTRADRAGERDETLDGLVARGVAPGEELREARAERAATAAEVRALKLQARRIEREGSVRSADREARIAELSRAKVELEGSAKVAQVTLDRLRYELETAVVRAPVAGRIGEIADVRSGSVVDSGAILARVIPEGELHVVAHFELTGAGRLQPEQPARLRFPGYPWTQFGTVAARVKTVSQEPANGVIRVELELDDRHGTSIPLAHSLPVFVEVEVERVSPLEMLLRAAGGWVEGS